MQMLMNISNKETIINNTWKLFVITIDERIKIALKTSRRYKE